MKANVKILLLGVTALAIFAIIFFINSGSDGDGGLVKTADFTALYTPEESDSTANEDAEARNLAEAEAKPKEPAANQKILFIGDSMLEGLMKRFIDYADQNNHELQTVVWYSSTTDVWANTDTLQYFMKKFDPSYIVICLGGNELFVRDIDKRKENIKKIVKKFGDTPYVWVSPPNWKDDTGINDAIISVVGKGRYFDSRSLTLARKADHAHPTDPAAVQWMDTIARWIKSPACDNPLVMEWPEKDVSARNVTMLAPFYR